MIDTRHNVEELAAALRSAAPTLEPAEQLLALPLHLMLLAGKPVTTRDLAASAGLDEGVASTPNAVDGVAGGDQ
jgi:hypothetical protein